MPKKILHICPLDKFIPPFVKFIRNNFEFNNHIFILVGDIEKFPVPLNVNVIHKKSKLQVFSLVKAMYEADKIILHSLFLQRIVQLLAIQPWLLKKCYWVMWGGDLYQYQCDDLGIRSRFNEALRAFVIRRMGHFVTYIKGDYELVKKWYGATGQYHECLMYTSNVYQNYGVAEKKHATVNIQVGNSADPSNNHLGTFEKLKPFRDQDIMVYAPLSYGDQSHAKTVIDVGKTIFGDKFKPITRSMPFEQYLDFLSKIDVAVFNHKRQQGMGNTITLLGLGKKVYMRKDVTPWPFFSGLCVNVFNIDSLDVDLLSKDVAFKNNKIISDYFSSSNLIKQLERIFV